MERAETTSGGIALEAIAQADEDAVDRTGTITGSRVIGPAVSSPFPLPRRFLTGTLTASITRRRSDRFAGVAGRDRDGLTGIGDLGTVT